MIILSIRLFFLAARGMNPEGLPQLSGFWACRYGRRRGLRNSLRSDSPRPFSSVFLATSPPDKGGIGGSCLYSNPFALRALPLYSLTETQGERRVNSITSIAGLFNPSLRRYAPQFSPIFSCENTGEEGESNPPLIAVRYPAYGARQGRIVIQRIFFPGQRKSLLH